MNYKEYERAAEEQMAKDPQISYELIDHDGGVVFGEKYGDTIAKPEEKDGHVLVIGGVGSGKTTCIAIPTLLSWKNRVFAIDIKSELHKETTKKRPDKLQNIRVFEPLNNDTLGYDPFHLLRSTTNQAQAARIISNALITVPADIKDPFWAESARNMLTGAILHFINERCSFVETIRKILSTPIKKLIEQLKASETKKVIYFINAFDGMSEKTLSGVYAELCRHIVIYVTDDDIEYALTREDCIKPKDLEMGKDIYIIIPEHLLDEWKNLLTLMISQFLKFFEERKDMDENAPPILFLLDEFARLGKIEKMTNALATLRSRKITICLILQSLAQLDLIYGKETKNVMCDTCAYKAVLSATDPDTQEIFSKLVGTYDRYKLTDSRNTRPILKLPTSDGVSTTTEERRIIKPEEFATLPDIVLLSPYGFFRVEKKPYYED
ncbi:MAG: type IV secretory system conjugative DNA transfer family protein [Tannerella sp.]|jgi:type IV secretion system protein VirD4|nr:type IV secretory system conjugative DNA transfer family protein [Tannerella sp.]